LSVSWRPSPRALRPRPQAVETQTYNVKNLVESFTDVVPCREDLGPYELSLTYNLVLHETAAAIDVQDPANPFDDILTPPYHITSTSTGTFAAVPQDPTQPSFQGHFTQWFGENSNKKNASATFTFTVIGKGSDGSKVKFHVTAHFNVTPTGQEFFFESPGVTNPQERREVIPDIGVTSRSPCECVVHSPLEPWQM
jgi:hypothetical protein